MTDREHELAKAHWNHEMHEGNCVTCYNMGAEPWEIAQLRTTVSRLEGENEKLTRHIAFCESGWDSASVHLKEAATENEQLRTRLALLERVRECAEESISNDYGSCQMTAERYFVITLLKESLSAARGEKKP